jgi:Tc5 transposase DNA-binding domain
MAAKLWQILPQYSTLEPPKFSTGWLVGFKARHNIKRRKRHGKAAQVNKEQMEEGLKKIREICTLYPLRDIFNMDETTLNYKASPETSLSSKLIPGGKINKKKITTNFCYNADGN